MLWLFAGAGELTLGIAKAVEGVSGPKEWAQLAWYFVSGVGLLGLALKARRKDQAPQIVIDRNP
ncbi:MAG: hypothetical protein LC780_15870 [Acidobacteria bacterium]|nr:hypothetical protein [Acidobacteriota bacterium]